MSDEETVSAVFRLTPGEDLTQPNQEVSEEADQSDSSSGSSEAEAVQDFLEEESSHEDGDLIEQALEEVSETEQSMLIANLRGEDEEEGKPISSADLNVIYRHVDRKTVHFGNSLDPLDKLACSRPLTAKYVVEAEDRFERLFPKCKTCFGLK